MSYYKQRNKQMTIQHNNFYIIIIIIIIIIFFFLQGLGRLTRSGIDALPSFPGASTISSSSSFVVEGVFRQSGVVHCFKMVDPVLFVFGSHVFYSRDLYFDYFYTQNIATSFGLARSSSGWLQNILQKQQQAQFVYSVKML